MVYNVIGLMSGSSLDGLDIAYVRLEEVRGNWNYEILKTECVEYTPEWKGALRNASSLSALEYLNLDTKYGKLIGTLVNSFIAQQELEHKVHFIASHGHTVFHEPASFTTAQLGDGASIAAITGLPVINDLRSVDVALGGQGAPIVPIADKLLFGDYNFLLNLGGIANISVKHGDAYTAFDICPANQMLNALAAREQLEMDRDGLLAAKGAILPEKLASLEQFDFYNVKPPRSLSNSVAMAMSGPVLEAQDAATSDLLATATTHIANEVERAIRQNGNGISGKMLVTGGGALNKTLVNLISARTACLGIEVDVPEENTVLFKEALAMALLGVLRWREEANVLSSVSGASRDSVGGALWLS
ncbi:MAG: anhydro-N-acetylmuramic acid kinase [Taibaiella sp.]|nr:anhydro-N-acetylmuramic acid kinase [Taibaiella sp.]